MVFSFIKKPESSVTWSRQEPVKTQYFTTQLSTLTYSTTGVMSSTTSGTFTTTARATTISSNVSYSYQEGNVYSTSISSTTISLPDGRTATSFGTMSTELKYSYYPDRKQTGDKYVATGNNYVGNLYSTIASSTRRSCIIFDQAVNKTINTYISSVYTPAYYATLTTLTTEDHISFTRYLLNNKIWPLETLGSKITLTWNETGVTYPGRYQGVENINKLLQNTSFSNLSFVNKSLRYRHGTHYITDLNDPLESVNQIEYSVTLSKEDAGSFSFTTSWASLEGLSLISTSSSSSLNSNSTYKTTAKTWSFLNSVLTIDTVLSSTETATTLGLIVPDFDGKISAHNIADSMYYTLNYTYPFEESKTSYILRSDSITHQYYRSTTKEVKV